MFINRIVIPFLCALTLLAPQLANAAEPEQRPDAAVPEQPQPHPWQGVQIKTALHGQVELGHPDFAWRGTIANFSWPSKGASAFFAYTGPKFQLTKHLWISPQVGAATGFLGTEWGLGSMWVGIGHKRFSAFLQGDIYVRTGQMAHYALGSVDWSPIPQLTFGAHTEELKGDFTVGGHVDWHVNKRLTFSVRNFTSPLNGDTSVRIVTHVAIF